uniref:LYR motif containing 4 n=1 Tax=Myotis myotis TaxID=51298 RepID=A0A7J7ZYA6_MYOMY|nr:LYR motif containing 4 [Myotis myotis]
MAASSRARVLDLYRAMLRESKQFSAYNYRTYAIRKIRDAFRENKNMKDPVEIQALVNKAKRDLEMIRRQGEKMPLLLHHNSLMTTRALHPKISRSKVLSPQILQRARRGSPVTELASRGHNFSSAGVDASSTQHTQLQLFAEKPSAGCAHEIYLLSNFIQFRFSDQIFHSGYIRMLLAVLGKLLSENQFQRPEQCQQHEWEQ